ncbi:MAG: hypothetical protein JO071_01760 [Deltaproteobacteria bacterium]|nr:hypothetical protein [Deltaproteobacteria bacterium]
MKNIILAGTAALMLFTFPMRAFADDGPPPQSGTVIFNSIPSPLPGNVDSEGPEAYSFHELGDGIAFPTGTGGVLTTIKVVLASWECVSGNWYTAGTCLTNPPHATFSQPITMNIYQVDESNQAQPKAGAMIGSVTSTFQIPYRPSSNTTRCPDGQRWYDPADGNCYHGLAVPLTFDFSRQHISLPSEIVVGVAFNTETAGPTPLGPKSCDSPTFNNNADCPYDSLNISTYGDVFTNFDGTKPANHPLVSSVIDPNGIFVNYIIPANACNKTITPGVLEDDTVPNNGEPASETCFTGYHPELEIRALCGGPHLPRCPSVVGGQPSADSDNQGDEKE